MLIAVSFRPFSLVATHALQATMFDYVAVGMMRNLLPWYVMYICMFEFSLPLLFGFVAVLLGNAWYEMVDTFLVRLLTFSNKPAITQVCQVIGWGCRSANTRRHLRNSSRRLGLWLVSCRVGTFSFYFILTRSILMMLSTCSVAWHTRNCVRRWSSYWGTGSIVCTSRALNCSELL